jgi:membrane fusion protein (multidrug efflux system)
MPQIPTFRAAILFAAGLILVACSDSKPQAQAPGPAPAVTVVKVTSEEVRPSANFTGRIEAKDKIDLRARVDGFLEKRLFVEGADVKEGDLLFVIEKGLYEAAVEQAKGGLEKAQAALKLADLEVERQSELLRRNVAAQAKLDEVTAKQGEARGEVLGQKAALEKAQLQLSYTDIRAPIAGRIGRASVSVGNFVTAQSSALATIVSQDPIYVSFPVTQREILAIRKARGENTSAPPEAVIHVLLADGSRYPQPGKINFFDVTVNQGTDTVQVRAVFPNPDRILVDGQLVSVAAEGGRGENLLLVPQQALQLDQSGSYVLVVDRDNKIQVRRIERGEDRGARTIVRKGLEADESVVVEGIQRVRPGQVVQPTETKPQASACSGKSPPPTRSGVDTDLPARTCATQRL